MNATPATSAPATSTASNVATLRDEPSPALGCVVTSAIVGAAGAGRDRATARGAVVTLRFATRWMRSIDMSALEGAIGSSAAARSATLAMRASRGFARQRAITSSRTAGASGANARNGGAGSVAMRAHRPCTVSACQTGLPVTSSYKITPSAHTSVRASTSFALTICSGDM